MSYPVSRLDLKNLPQVVFTFFNIHGINRVDSEDLEVGRATTWKEPGSLLDSVEQSDPTDLHWTIV